MQPNGTITAQCVVDETWFDTKTPEEIKAYVEDWCANNWIGEKEVWVCPMLDGHICFGAEVDWERVHDGGL